MYWTKAATYSSTALEIEGERTLWDENGLIKFSNNCAFYISGEEYLLLGQQMVQLSGMQTQQELVVIMVNSCQMRRHL